MTREDIIRMAREAGFDDFFCRDLMLELFAALVAEHERAAEREAICELADNLLRTSDAVTLIDAIRARGSK
jgi:hypothetical protein